MKKLTIIIPVFNEEKTIIKVLERINKVNLSQLGIGKEVIVVDDGSVDTTFDKINKNHNGIILRHANNQGKGMAIRTGLEEAKGDIIIIQDADLEYHPECYPELIKPILSGQAQVVFGSRFLNGKYPMNMDMPHFLANKFLTLLANILFNIHITDESTCYKVFKSEAIKGIKLTCRQFEFCPEVIAKLSRGKIKIHEIPISYTARTKAEGKKIEFKDAIQAILTLIKYRFFS